MSFQVLQIDDTRINKFARAHDFPKFVKVGAAMEHKLRKVGTSSTKRRIFIAQVSIFKNYRVGGDVPTISTAETSRTCSARPNAATSRCSAGENSPSLRL